MLARVIQIEQLYIFSAILVNITLKGIVRIFLDTSVSIFSWNTFRFANFTLHNLNSTGHLFTCNERKLLRKRENNNNASISENIYSYDKKMQLVHTREIKDNIQVYWIYYFFLTILYPEMFGMNNIIVVIVSGQKREIGNDKKFSTIFSKFYIHIPSTQT